MTSSFNSPPNTSPTPQRPGRWVVSEFGIPSVLKWETWDPTNDLSNEKNVLIKILVAGIAGVDNIQRAGGYPGAPQPGFTTGYDLVGEVVHLGDSVPKVSKLKLGDRVASLCRYGGYATHIVLPYQDVMRIEPTDDPLKIGTLPLNYMTAWGMLKHSGVKLSPGSSILIGSASGGLGTAMAQIVKAFKMDIKMIGACSRSKFDYVRSLGVHPLDRTATDLVEQVREITNGEGVDVAYDGVCSDESVKNFLAATKKDSGKVIVFGVMGDIPADGSKMLDGVQNILAKHLQPPCIDFFLLDVEYQRKAEIAEFYEMVEKVRSGELDPVVAKLLPLSQAVEAHEMLISGTVTKGKMLFIVDQELATKYGI
ncbi:hypothetical protein DE146DRAFT_735298 [Phaeosphaeria sp. MPI-PUGE-AT-0046c]|nr:hypothetical protein DE146DRAFT_735298 [Phaeosphaeria sp. MPI-PUGE-AT-0046c]